MIIRIKKTSGMMLAILIFFLAQFLVKVPGGRKGWVC